MVILPDLFIAPVSPRLLFSLHPRDKLSSNCYLQNFCERTVFAKTGRNTGKLTHVWCLSIYAPLHSVSRASFWAAYCLQQRAMPGRPLKLPTHTFDNSNINLGNGGSSAKTEKDRICNTWNNERTPNLRCPTVVCACVLFTRMPVYIKHRQLPSRRPAKYEVGPRIFAGCSYWSPLQRQEQWESLFTRCMFSMPVPVASRATNL